MHMCNLLVSPPHIHTCISVACAQTHHMQHTTQHPQHKQKHPGDLGAIDAKYDIAASTAVAALDYIVVDSTADAQTAVEYLRRNNLGVATFLILDKQQHLAGAAKKPATPPEGVPRLFDLVRCGDERLRVAFYYAMRDTVVAGDLEQASRIAYGGDGRWRRVVTLKVCCGGGGLFLSGVGCY